MKLDLTTKQACLDLAGEFTKGAELFDASGQPTDAVRRYTGGRLLQDTERCVFVGALRLLGCSDRKIAAAVGCDVRSIPLMLEEAEKTGRIPALKDRLVRLIGQNAERAQIALADLLNRTEGCDSMELSAMIKAVGTVGGINATNYQLLTGGATERIEHNVRGGRAEIEAWAKQNAIDLEPITAAVDSQSSGNRTERQQIEAFAADDAHRDTQPAQAEPDRAGADGAGASGREGGGGGADAGAPGPGPHPLTGLKIFDEVAFNE